MTREQELSYRDPRWDAKRKHLYRLAEYKCQRCNCEDSPLHAHHRLYVQGRQPWDYPDDDFEVLCERCHAEHHRSGPTFFSVWNASPRIATPHRRRACRKADPQQMALPLKFYGQMPG